MKKYIVRKLLILVLLFLSAWTYAEHPGARFYLSPESLEKLIKKGLSGNMEAGTSVWEYYAL
ncbi:hypothetical protein [Treponema pedis]|uniref:hypothetical protein n=1 Tax=Treponema pedis TaxID=409322 RepID=UPI001981E427|nr:hypothetical protein [Treponema pedis]QSI04443.1 hypothetical protein DYQ05_05590 [Treponema pedis]